MCNLPSYYPVTPMLVPHTLFRHRSVVGMSIKYEYEAHPDMLNMCFMCPQPCSCMVCHSQSPLILEIPRGLEGEQREWDK